MQNLSAFFSAAAAAAIVLVSGLPHEARAASWTVCNRTPDRLTIAIGYPAVSAQILTEGWWTIGGCGGCAIVMDARTANQLPDKTTTYLRAEFNDGSGSVEGDENFCVDANAFHINSTASPGCNDMRSFRTQQVNLNKNHTTNITGRGRSGQVCID